MGDTDQDDRARRLTAPVPVLAAVGVAVAGRLREDRIGRAAFLGLCRERVVRRELAARVQRERLGEVDAGTLGDAVDLIGDAGEVALDRRDPPGRVLLDLGPFEPGDLLEGLAVVRDRVADLRSRGLAVLASDLAVAAAELDRGKSDVFVHGPHLS